MLAHLGAMLGRRRAMLVRRGREVELCWPNMRARNATKRTKKQTKTKLPQKTRSPMLRRIRPRCPPGSPQARRPFWVRVGPAMGAVLAYVEGCVASAGPCWANLGPILPHLDAMSAHLKHMLSNLGPRLAQKKTKRKNHGKTNGFARFRNHVDAMLAHLWGYVCPSWGYVGPSWGYVGPS